MEGSGNDPRNFRHFFAASDLARLYKEHRPTYPLILYKTIAEYLGQKLSPPFSLAVDVGCGSGQSSFPLSLYFDGVLGIDISAAQISEAQSHPDKPRNVEFRVGDAFEIASGDSSATLVCSGTAAHWFDPIEDFYREVDRVLVPGGCLAIFTYGTLRVNSGQNSDQINDAIDTFINHNGATAFRPQKAEDALDNNLNYHIPYTDKTRVDSLTGEFHWNLNQLVGYLSSWSFYQRYIKSRPREADPLLQLKIRILELNSGAEETLMPVTFPITLFMGRKPLE
ncbi:hypothetical protein CAPTEDRAFT_198720 [Capitella teleta]|uniref:Methyltransferase type 11 domain-containing protein n=1 Tax=Capitella teleta TaxID=283909 RepID=R7VB38_CAPTE|nr:hypothetical protein CAPTEDRAFT_198720 [Capitella teleta]|eukprot:ELU12920.1 hypothetical protein CAPTEDRAFT_198720 [Capitella teleta]